MVTPTGCAPVSAVVGCVVLYHRAGAERLDATLRAVLRGRVAPAHVLVVDNASGDGVARQVAKRWGAPVLERVANDGYAGGMRAGCEALPEDVTHALLLTHECQLAPDALAVMLGSLSGDVGLAAPRLRTLDGTAWSDGGAASHWFRRPRHQQAAVLAGTRDVDWVDGAAMLLRRDLVALLPTCYGLYFEDVELGLRVREQGLRVVVVGAAGASQQTGGAPPFWLARGWVLLERRTAGTGRAAGATAVLAGMALRQLLRRQAGASGDTLRGITAGWRADPEGSAPSIEAIRMGRGRTREH